MSVCDECWNTAFKIARTRWDGSPAEVYEELIRTSRHDVHDATAPTEEQP